MTQRHEEWKREPSHSKEKKRAKIQFANGMQCQTNAQKGVVYHSDWCNSIAISSQILLLGIHLIESSEK